MAKKEINKTSTILLAGTIYSLVFLLVLALLLKPKVANIIKNDLIPLGVEWSLIIILALIFIFIYYKKNARR